MTKKGKIKLIIWTEVNDLAVCTQYEKLFASDSHGDMAHS